MKKIFLLCLLMQSIFFNCLSQVNYQSGSAVFGIPMLDWKENISRLNLNISLNYNSGNGLKTNDVASNVGQGWNLMAGGVISRMQVGEPDDQKPFHQYTNEAWDDTKKYPAGYLYTQFDITKGVSNSINQYPIFKAKNLLYKQFNDVADDKELDRFSFQFNGKAGIFILDKATKTGVPLEYANRMKITFTTDENNSANQIRTTIVAFNILDEGIIYKFTKFSKTKLLKSSFCSSDLINKLTQPKFEDNKVYHESLFEDAQIINPYVINEWVLEEIEDAFTHRKINFTYTTRNLNVDAGTSPTHYDELNQKNYSIITHQKSSTQTQELTGITMPDGYQVMLNYGNERADFRGEFALSSIETKYQNRWVSKYLLDTKYFIKNRIGIPKSDFQKSIARLCLKSVTKLGVDLKAQDEPYKFDYYLGSNNVDDYVPAPFSFFRDIWGFYNGDYSKDYNNNPISLLKQTTDFSNTDIKGLCFRRINSNNVALNAKPGYAKNGLLKQIIYPTGGALNYEYEQNVAYIEGLGITSNTGGVHVSKTLVTDGGYNNDCNNPLVNSFSYVNESGTQSSLWGVEVPQNQIAVSSYYSPAKKYFSYKPIANFSCKYKFQYPGILSKEQGIDLNGNQKLLQALSQVLEVCSAVSQIIDIVNIISVGGPQQIVAIIIDIIFSVYTLITTCLDNPEKNSTTAIFYNSDLNGVNPLPSMFKRVEIIESGGTNGKTIMEFTSKDDYPIWMPSNPSYSMQQRFAPWAYGLLKKIIVLDNLGNKVKETVNTYRYIKNNTIFYNDRDPGYELYPNCKYLITKNVSKRSDDWLNPNNYSYPSTYFNQSNSEVLINTYGIFQGNTFLTQIDEKDYVQNSANFKLSTTINNYATCFDCSNYGLLDSVIKINNSGSTLSYKFNYLTYGYSFQSQTFNFYMNIFLPSAKIFYRDNKLLSKNSTIYLTTTSGLICPYKSLETRYNIPNQLNPNTIETQSITYDPFGNLIGQRDEAKRNVSNFFDYNDKFLVATVINAEANIDKCAYSSFETPSLGGWLYDASYPSYSSNSVTGARSLQLVSGSSLYNFISRTKPYKISFWATNVLTLPSIATLVKNGPTINGFTYYEYDVSPGSNIISVTGNGNIDELRFVPSISRMRTTTYDPLIGKTSQCDENNRITYFEYDDLGRMRFIKDDRKNVTKMYEYNVAKKSICPVTYSNLLVSESFTKNNCPSGYIGSDIIYTIPAGTYTSTFSQDAVDAQVDKNLTENGQNYANANGSCIPIYYNSPLSATFEQEGCPIGYIGTNYTYTIAAGTFTSLSSQADADYKAQAQLDANGQAYANAQETTGCVINYNPVFESTGFTQCVNGQYQIQVKDVNPNSSTYNQIQWANSNDPCPTGTPIGPTSLFIRLEKANEYFYSDNYYSVHSGDLNANFYQNSACTIPLTLSSDLSIYYHYDYSYYHSTNGSRFNIYDAYGVANSGSNQYAFGQIVFSETYNYGTQPYSPYPTDPAVVCCGDYSNATTTITLNQSTNYTIVN